MVVAKCMETLVRYDKVWHVDRGHKNAGESSLHLTMVSCGMTVKETDFGEGGWSYQDLALAPCHLLHRTTDGVGGDGATTDAGSAYENVATDVALRLVEGQRALAAEQSQHCWGRAQEHELLQSVLAEREDLVGEYHNRYNLDRVRLLGQRH